MYAALSRSNFSLALPKSGAARALVAVLGAAYLYFLYTWCWRGDAPDARIFLIPWFDHIVESGPIAVFAAPFSDYDPPYLYLLSLSTLLEGHFATQAIIRGLSLILTALMAFCSYRLMVESSQNRRSAFLCASALFAVPNVAINAAMLGQCDPFWVAPLLLALVAAHRGKAGWLGFWCGLAFAIKAQSIFFAPFAIIMFLRMPWRWYHWLVPGLTYLACLAPAAIISWPIDDLLTIYLRQTTHYNGSPSMGADNIWMMLTYLGVDELYLCIFAAFALTYVVIRRFVLAANRATLVTQGDMVSLALFPALAMPYFLPIMHERYFFLADILALALYFIERDRRTLAIAVTLHIGTTLNMCAYMFGEVSSFERDDGKIALKLADPNHFAFGVGAFAMITVALILTWQRVVMIRDRV